MAKKFDYTGVEVLEAMENAQNYNNYLQRLVIATIRKRTTTKSKLLDFGAGTGTYARMLNKNYSLSPVCLEPDTNLSKNLKKSGFGILTKIDKNVGDFGTVYSLNVFEHIKDDAKVAKDLYKQMSPGSTLLIYVPAFQVLYSSMDKLVEHHRRYDKKRLQKILSDAGFKIDSLYYADPLGFFAALVYKIFDKGDGVISPLGVKIFDRFVFPISLLLQPLTRHLFGKNVVAIAVKEES